MKLGDVKREMPGISSHKHTFCHRISGMLEERKVARGVYKRATWVDS